MQVKQYPFYIKSTVILLGIVLLVYILVTLRGILVPFSFALIIAILLNPLVNRFRKWGVGHIVSIILAMLVAVLIFGGYKWNA